MLRIRLSRIATSTRAVARKRDAKTCGIAVRVTVCKCENGLQSARRRRGEKKGNAALARYAELTPRRLGGDCRLAAARDEARVVGEGA